MLWLEGVGDPITRRPFYLPPHPNGFHSCRRGQAESLRETGITAAFHQVPEIIHPKQQELALTSQVPALCQPPPSSFLNSAPSTGEETEV